jgi:hypothetical protein
LGLRLCVADVKPAILDPRGVVKAGSMGVEKRLLLGMLPSANCPP